MASCSEQDVRDRIQTELIQAVVLRLINEADNELLEDLGGSGLSSGQKKRACALLTCEIIAKRYPKSFKVGGMSVTNPDDYAKGYRRSALKVIKKGTGRGGIRVADRLLEED